MMARQVKPGATTVPRLTPEQLSTYTRDETKAKASAFDLVALQTSTTRVMGHQCDGVHLVEEGGYNQVYILTFVSGVDVIGRLQGSSANQDDGFPQHMITSRFLSEVATLGYVRQNTSIPVPEVYHYDANPCNPVGALYMLQERMPGDCLGSNITFLWHHMTFDQRKKIVTQIANYEAQLLRLRLPSIGRIFRAPGLNEDDSTHSPRKNPLQDPAYFIGSLGFPVLSSFGFDVLDAGPWTTTSDYILSSINNQLFYVTERASECVATRKSSLAPQGKQDSPDIIHYLQTAWKLLFESVGVCFATPRLQFLSDPSSRHFAIHHPDVGVTNIMISYDDSTLVTGIIDWEGASVLPIWSNPRGQRLLNADQLELRALRLQTFNDAVPDYKEICGIAEEFSLDHLIRIVQYNSAAWMDRPAINDLLLTWVRDVEEPHQHHVMDLRCFLEDSAARQKQL